MLNLNPNSKTPPSYEQMILSEIRGMKDDIRDLHNELNGRMDRIETRIDRFDNEIRSAMRHSQIMTGSVVGIALAVIYFVFTH